MEYIAECLEKFRELHPDFRNDLGAGQAYDALKRIEEEYRVSLSFVLVLLAVEELGEDDLPEYLEKKYKLSKPKAKVLGERMAKEVFLPALYRHMPFLGPDKETTSIDVQAVFLDKLVEKINGSQENLNAFNLAVFEALAENIDLEDRLISLLCSNKEVITGKDITIDGKNKKGTVGNWIKLFVVENGSGMFDGLVLAKFLSSPVCEGLSGSERTLVSKVLKTYRNLVFFPESMENVPLELWEVLPVENEQGITDVLADNPMESQEQLKSKQNLAGKLREKKMEEKKPVEYETKSDVDGVDKGINISTASKLQQALGDYAPGSLEYKVIKQELDRLRMSASVKS